MKLKFKFKAYILSVLVFMFSSINVFAVQSPEEDVSKARLLLGPNRWVQLHYFLQTGFSSEKTWDSENETDEDEYRSKDFFVKRSRVILNGQISKEVFFFFQSDDLKAGASSSDDTEENNTPGSNNVFTQDAYLQLKFADQFQIYAGLLALPFSRQNNQSAATTLGTDLNSLMLPLNNYSNNGRDTGFLFRGLLFNKILEYRLGAFRGLDRKYIADGNVRNEDDYPRVSGRLQLNFLEKEEGFFYSGNYLGKRSIVALGAAFDYQKDVYLEDDTYEDYLAWTVDLAFDLAISGGNSATVQAGVFKSDKNPAEGLVSGDLKYNKLYGWYAQAGTLIFGKVQPFAKYIFRRNRDYDGGGSQKYQQVAAGLNYFIHEHHANVKFEYVYPFGDDSKDFPGEEKGTLQLQVYM